MDAIERDDLFERAGAPARRGQAAPLRRRARPGDRLARRGPARDRRARHRVGPDRLQRARAGARPRLPRRRGATQGCGVMARVPTSSGLLEDKYTLETTFPKHDHRSHRPREWLVEGLQKVERLRFLCEEHGITMAQAALKFILAQHAIACVLPTVAERAGPRGVGRRVGRARPDRRGPRADLTSSTSATSTSSRSAPRPRATAGLPGTSRVPRCPSPAARSRGRPAWTASPPTALPAPLLSGWAFGSSCSEPCGGLVCVVRLIGLRRAALGGRRAAACCCSRCRRRA